MSRRRKKGPRKAVKVSFVVTFSILVLLFIGFIVYEEYFFVPTGQLPSPTPVYDLGWAKYVPNNVIQFSYQNFTYVRELNSSLPFFSRLIHLTTPPASFNTTDVNHFVTMVFEAPNASVDFAFMKPDSYASFESQFAGLQPYSTPVGNASIYQVQDTATGKPVLGWLALVPNDMAVGFSPGLSAARQGLVEALVASTRPNSSVIGLPDVRQMLYLSGGASKYIGVGLTSFSGINMKSQKTMTSVGIDGIRLNLTRTVEFSDSSTAYGQYSTVKFQYPKASYVVVFDTYVRASELDSLSDLGGDYRLVQ
jgi:hypothetical protein